MKLNKHLLLLASLIQGYRDFLIRENMLIESLTDTNKDWYNKTQEYYYSLDKKYFETAGIIQNEWHYRQLLHYDITKEIDKTHFDELSKFDFPDEEKYKENIVSSYLFFMWNGWCKKECELVFGWEFQHFWDKWCGMCRIFKTHSATEKFYADLTEHNRVKLVSRACVVYNGSERREQHGK